MKLFSITWLFLLLTVFTPLLAQEGDLPENWFNLDLQADGYPGMSTDKAYQELLADKKGQTVVVAVIDSGVDFDHEDLAANMWRNPGETPDNGIDDDKNGYVDDVYGWNFIGGKDGQHVHHENLEVVRLYNKLKPRYENADPQKLSGDARKEYDKYQEYKKAIEEKREDLAPNVMVYEAAMQGFDGLIAALKKDKEDITIKDLENFKSSDDRLNRAARVMLGFMQQGESFASIYEQLGEAYDYYNGQYNYNWNPDFDSRDIVGDDPSNLSDRNYGNSNVEGISSHADHGTHVAGIIGAVRGNGIGIDGVAQNVRIMAIRVVPNGDERDKDVANAIRYAVDNGAQVINMSFGKGASPYKEAVDEAVKYAADKDVLLVHGSGNDSKENQLDDNFPNDHYNKRGLFGPKMAENWIEVGASTWMNDENLIAEFSNYSADKVDVLAPGLDIYSTVPSSSYKNLQGTSMASPMVAGTAALLRSYFPDLTAEQVKDIIMESTVRVQERVKKPGTDEIVPVTKIAVTGGVVNVYKAVQLAMQTKGKKKKTAERDPALNARA